MSILAWAADTLRMGMFLMRTSQVYLPPDLRKGDYAPEEKASYYLMNWPYLRGKWKKVGAHLGGVRRKSAVGPMAFDRTVVVLCIA